MGRGAGNDAGSGNQLRPRSRPRNRAYPHDHAQSRARWPGRCGRRGQRRPPRPQLGAAGDDTTETLTPRELEVLRLLAQGRSNQAIANELVVAVGTVKRHVNSLFGKLGVQSRLEAVARARALDLVE